MPERCPLCNQPLPKGLELQSLHTRLDKLTSRAVAKEESRIRAELADEYNAELEAREDAIRKAAAQEAKDELKKKVAAAAHEAEKVRREKALLERRMAASIEEAKRDAARKAGAKLKDALTRIQREAAAAERRAAEAERRRKEEILRVQENADREIQRAESRAARLAAKQNHSEMERLKLVRERERARHEAETARLQQTVEALSRKLERQTSQQRGDEGEVDLFAALKGQFPEDRIERVGKGVRGADVIHRVIVNSREVGRIVFESKNVASWQNAFLIKAKRCQSQYSTPYVVIVTRAFPRNRRGFCVFKGIPIVEPSMAVALACILRDAIAEIGELRVASSGRDDRAKQLMAYILSDEFRTRFEHVAESVASLRELQERERDWHENTWQKQADLFDELDSRRREIGARIKGITRDAAVARKPRLVGVGS